MPLSEANPPVARRCGGSLIAVAFQGGRRHIRAKMKNAVLPFVVAAGLALSSAVQASDRAQLAEKLLILMKTPELSQAQMDQVQRMQAQRLAALSVSDAQRAQVDNLQAKTRERITAVLSWDAVKTDYIALYSEMFTEDELKALVNFYQTPVGQKLVAKSPMLTTKSNQVMQVRYDKLAADLNAMTDAFRAGR
jgi:hypothetical protein